MEFAAMRVFISWSGKVSHRVALALKDWLPSVIQAIEPFVSSEDIQKGARWFYEVGSQLEETEFGILCITPDNLAAPWVLFEAGALSKHLGQARVSPLLIGVSNADLQGPLAHFNTTTTSREDVEKLLKSINAHLKDHKLSNEKLDKTFNVWWPELEKHLKEILVVQEAGGATRANAIGHEERSDGARMIVQIVKDIAGERGISLDEVNWSTDPTQEVPTQSSETYTLVVRASEKVERQVFPREDLEDAPRSERARRRVQTILKYLLRELSP